MARTLLAVPSGSTMPLPARTMVVIVGDVVVGSVPVVVTAEVAVADVAVVASTVVGAVVAVAAVASVVTVAGVAVGVAAASTVVASATSAARRRRLSKEVEPDSTGPLEGDLIDHCAKSDERGSNETDGE